MRTKLDKIFDNRFHESEPIAGDIQFKVVPAYDAEVTAEDRFHYDEIFSDINKLIENSSYSNLNTSKKNNKLIKLNKIQINEIYIFVLAGINIKYSKIDIWNVMSDYFDILPNKFYNSLSNNLKNDLMNNRY